MDAARLFGQTFDFNLGKLSFSPSYFQAGAIVVLLFLLVVTMAQVRRHFLRWSAKGGLFGIFLGFALALILEGFLIIGGKTAFTEIIGWENAPKPIKVALEAGRARLVTVLGVFDEIPVSSAENKTPKDVFLQEFQSLPPDEAQSVQEMICTP